MNIGENIRKYRKEKKITQKQLASLINKSIRTVQKYETGEIEPSLEALIDISKILKVSLIELTEEKYLTPSQEFLNNLIKNGNETLESLSKQTGVPLKELESLYNNTPGGYNMETYIKFYNYFGLSKVETCYYMFQDNKFNYIYNNNCFDEDFNIERDEFVCKIGQKDDFGIDMHFKKNSDTHKNEVQNYQIEHTDDKNAHINNASDEAYICDSRKISNIYEIEDIYKEKINNQKKYIEDIKAVKDELNRILKEKNLIIDKLEKIIHNLEKNNNSLT